MNSAKKAATVVQVLSKRYCSCVETKPSSYFKSLKQKQAKFQCDDGLPVFLKGGISDKIMYQATLIMILVATPMTLKLFWELAVPRKN